MCLLVIEQLIGDKPTHDQVARSIRLTVPIVESLPLSELPPLPIQLAIDLATMRLTEVHYGFSEI